MHTPFGPLPGAAFSHRSSVGFLSRAPFPSTIASRFFLASIRYADKFLEVVFRVRKSQKLVCTFSGRFKLVFFFTWRVSSIFFGADDRKVSVWLSGI